MIARLHHELVAEASPRRWLALLHGICGASTNLRGVARRVVTARPDWGIALFDLRNHGRSDDGTPPDTVAACADDVLAASPVALAAIAGHSFGGKVAMVARRRARFEQTWLLDASPAARPRGLGAGSQVAALLATMAALPVAWQSRGDYTRAVTAAGHPVALAQWLAMSLREVAPGVLASRLDAARIRAMLADYDACDAWDAVALPGDVEVIAATRESALDAEDLERLAAMPNVRVHRVDAGHWVHAEAPDAVVALIAERLPRS